MKRPAPDPTDTDIAQWEAQLRKGGLGLAVLASLWRGRLYGLQLLKVLETRAGLKVPEGTIYPLLNRLKTAGLVASEWVESEAGHPRKYYSLTDDGRRQARDIARAWFAFVAGLNSLLDPLQETA